MVPINNPFVSCCEKDLVRAVPKLHSRIAPFREFEALLDKVSL